MPLFEYRSKDCSQVFEVYTQRREPSATPTCPECGKTNVERILSPFSGTTSAGGSCSTRSLGFG